MITHTRGEACQRSVMLGTYRDEHGCQISTCCWVAGDLDPVHIHSIPQCLLQGEGALRLYLKCVICPRPDMLRFSQVLASQSQLLPCSTVLPGFQSPTSSSEGLRPNWWWQSRYRAWHSDIANLAALLQMWGLGPPVQYLQPMLTASAPPGACYHTCPGRLQRFAPCHEGRSTKVGLMSSSRERAAWARQKSAEKPERECSPRSFWTPH